MHEPSIAADVGRVKAELEKLGLPSGPEEDWNRQDRTDAYETSEKADENTPGSDPARYFDSNGFIPALLGAKAQGAGHLRIAVDGRLWRYVNGVYLPDGDTFVLQYVRRALGERYRKRHGEEVIAWCKAEFPSIPERPDEGIINVANGLLEWRTGTLYPHDPDVPSVVQLPVAWNPDARCPAIESFLSDVLPGDAIALAFEIAGYCLLSTQPLRRAVMFLGSGSNGKSTTLGVLRALLGTRNVSSIPLQQFGESRFAAAELYGKLANLCGDLDARALRRSDMFKVVTGAVDEVMAERKFGQPFKFVPFATLVFSANEAPASSDQTDAYFDRWIVLPFDRRFDEDEGGDADPHLLANLTSAPELEGLLVWAVDSLRALMDRGRFALPESVREAGRMYREKVDTVTAFIDEACVVDVLAKVTRAGLYQAYREWCGSNGRMPVSQQTFGPKVRQALGDQVEEVKIGGDADRGWAGIGLRA